MKNPEGSAGPRRRLLVVLQRIFLVIAIGFVGSYLALNADAVTKILSRTSPHRLGLAIVFAAALHPIVVLAYWCIQRGLDIGRTYGQTLAIHVFRLPARYIPGGIWQSLARYGDVALDEATPSSGFFRLFLLESLATAAGAAIATGSLWLVLGTDIPPGDIWPLLLLLAGATLAVLPLGWMLSRNGGAGIAARWVVAVASMSILWMASGGAFLVSSSATGDIFTGCEPIPVAATYTAAASAGYVAIFAPQGWGVTEAVFTALKPCGVEAPTAVAAVVAFRLVIALGDVALFVLFAVPARMWHRTNKPKKST